MTKKTTNLCLARWVGGARGGGGGGGRGA